MRLFVLEPVKSVRSARLIALAVLPFLVFAMSAQSAEDAPVMRLAKPPLEKSSRRESGAPELPAGRQTTPSVRQAPPVEPAPAARQTPAWGARLPVATGSTAATGASSSTTAPQDAATDAPLSIPLVQGYDSFGLSIPDHDLNGHLRSLFVIGAISRLDDRTVEIRESFLETYREDGSLDLSIEMPKARLDRFTRVLASQTPVTLRREEFQLKGETMEFNTVTRIGGLGGAVEMVIYNGADGIPDEERHPAKKTQKR